MAVLTSLTSLICTFPLFGHNHLFVCMIGWKPEMSANGLHHSHVPDFIWKITSTEILQFFAFKISRQNKVNFWNLMD